MLVILDAFVQTFDSSKQKQAVRGQHEQDDHSDAILRAPHDFKLRRVQPSLRSLIKDGHQHNHDQCLHKIASTLHAERHDHILASRRRYTCCKVLTRFRAFHSTGASKRVLTLQHNTHRTDEKLLLLPQIRVALNKSVRKKDWRSKRGTHATPAPSPSRASHAS